MYDVGDKLLGGIKSMYVDSLSCYRVKGGESERFRIDSGVRQDCIIPPWLFIVNMVAVMKEVKMSMGKRGVRFMRRGENGDYLALLYADDLVMCGESEENLRVMVGQFVEVC